MATLFHPRTEVEFKLGSLTRIGRSRDNDLVIDDPCVSHVHASLAWRGETHWELKDLGSSNGTFVRGERVGPGQWVQIEPSNTVAFGDPVDPWVLAHGGRPAATARCPSTRERKVAEGDILTLSEHPERWAEILEEVSGDWSLEREHGSELVQDGTSVDIDGVIWRLSLPVASPRTEPLSTHIDPPRRDNTLLEFRVSPDLEHVELIVQCEAHRATSTRAYVWCLLELARCRLIDENAGRLHPDEHGWIYADDLCSLAGYENESRLNVEVHRARREFARFGIPNAACIVQRRRTTRQIRIGTANLKIVQRTVSV